MESMGTDTFRGSGGTVLRDTLYQKNLGDIDVHRSGLLRVGSPISGNLLVSTTSNKRHMRDPTAGAVLRYHSAHAIVTTPVAKQELRMSRKFYLTKDVDISIQTLRNTTKVSRYTNEKVGTAGTPTGMDQSLSVYSKAASKAAQAASESGSGSGGSRLGHRG